MSTFATVTFYYSLFYPAGRAWFSKISPKKLKRHNHSTLRSRPGTSWFLLVPDKLFRDFQATRSRKFCFGTDYIFRGKRKSGMQPTCMCYFCCGTVYICGLEFRAWHFSKIPPVRRDWRLRLKPNKVAGEILSSSGSLPEAYFGAIIGRVKN